MPNSKNHKRPIQVKFFVNEKELALIKERMAQLGIENMSAYLRKMAVDGCEEKPNIPELHESKKTVMRLPCANCNLLLQFAQNKKSGQPSQGELT